MKHLMLILLVSTTMFGANQGAQRAPMSYNRMSYDGAMATLRAYRPEQWDANSFQRIKPYLDRASLQEQGQFLDDFTRAMGSSEASLPYHRAMLYQGLFGEDSALKKKLDEMSGARHVVDEHHLELKDPHFPTISVKIRHSTMQAIQELRESFAPNNVQHAVRNVLSIAAQQRPEILQGEVNVEEAANICKDRMKDSQFESTTFRQPTPQERNSQFWNRMLITGAVCGVIVGISHLVEYLNRPQAKQQEKSKESAKAQSKKA